MNEQQETRPRLLESYRQAGNPMATVILPARSDVADAADRYEIRIKNCLSRLAELGASEALMNTVEQALDESDHADGSAFALVASADGVIVSHSMFRPVSSLFVALGPTPALLPLLEATQSDLPHVAVLLDRVGADIWYRADLGTAVDTMSVSGEDLHVQRSQPGGWSQRRFQQIAENTWEENAKTVVNALLEDSPDVELVVAGGDVRAVGFFAEHLPERLGQLITVDGSRSADHDAFLDNADVAVRSAAAERMVEAINDFRDALGEGRAVEGRHVLELLGQGRIDHLYVANDTLSDNRMTAEIDFAVPMLSSDGSGSTCAATDAAVSLAVATGAEVTVVPSSVVDGMVGITRGPVTVP